MAKNIKKNTKKNTKKAWDVKDGKYREYNPAKCYHVKRDATPEETRTA